MHRAGYWVYDGEQNVFSACPYKAYNLIREIGTKEIVTQLNK